MHLPWQGPVLSRIVKLQGSGPGCVPARLYGIQSQRICAAARSGASQQVQEEQGPMKSLEGGPGCLAGQIHRLEPCGTYLRSLKQL